MEGARWCGKFLLANILAFAIFSCVSYFYVSGGRAPNARYVRLTEGATVLQLDANCLNNSYYNDFCRDLSDVDVLMLGSSHIEAYQVLKNENCAYLLNSRFADDEKPLAFYSCGVSGCFLPGVISRYESALEKFRPKNYVIIEIMSVPTVAAINQGFSESITYEPRKMSLARVFINNTGGMWVLNNFFAVERLFNARAAKNAVVEEDSPEELTEAWTHLVKFIVDTAQANGVKPILLCHKCADIAKDSSFCPRFNVDDMAEFRAICEREGIVFVDATERFREEYEKNNVWAYGFCNAGIISGHLNRDGHRMVADVLEEAIRKLEAEKEAGTTSATQNSEAVEAAVDAIEESEAKQ